MIRSLEIKGGRRSGEWWGTIHGEPSQAPREFDEGGLRRHRLQATGRIHVPVEQICPTPSLARLLQPRSDDAIRQDAGNGMYIDDFWWHTHRKHRIRFLLLPFFSIFFCFLKNFTTFYPIIQHPVYTPSPPVCLCFR